MESDVIINYLDLKDRLGSLIKFYLDLRRICLVLIILINAKRVLQKKIFLTILKHVFRGTPTLVGHSSHKNTQAVDKKQNTRPHQQQQKRLRFRSISTVDNQKQNGF